MVRKQTGKHVRPVALPRSSTSDAEVLLADLDTAETWRVVIEAEPALARKLTADEFDRAVLAVADFIDLKSPYTLGHARAVGELVADAAGLLGWTPDDVADDATGRLRPRLRSAGGVQQRSGTRPGPLGAGERERVRFAPYLTERMLRQSRGALPAGCHRGAAPGAAGRLGVPARALRRPRSHADARLLGAADAYQAMREPRPYRAARSADEAAAELRADVRKAAVRRRLGRGGPRGCRPPRAEAT